MWIVSEVICCCTWGWRGIVNIGVRDAGGTPSLILHWLYKGQIILVHSLHDQGNQALILQCRS